MNSIEATLHPSSPQPTSPVAAELSLKPSSKLNLPAAHASLKVTEEVKEFALTLGLCQGTHIALTLNDDDKAELNRIYTILSNGDETQVIDLQNGLNTNHPEVQKARQIVSRILKNPHFKWRNRPSNIRGDMSGPAPYTQTASTIQSLKWKDPLNDQQKTAHTMVDLLKNSLTRGKSAAEETYKQDPRKKHLRKDIETIGQMLARLQKVNMAAIDFEMAHPFPQVTPETLSKVIEERKDFALEFIGNNRSTYQSFKSKIFGNSEQMTELSFAYDLAIQGIPDRETYDQACSLIDIEPKQDTLELAIIQAAKQGATAENIFDIEPMKASFNKLSDEGKDLLSVAFQQLPQEK